MYIDFVNSIKSGVVSVLGGYKTYHGKLPDANFWAVQAAALPQVHIYPFRVVPNGNGTDTANNIVIMLYRQDRPDTNDTERDIIVDDADADARLLLNYLDGVMDIHTAEITPFYKLTSACLSGVMITLKATIIDSKRCDNGHS